MSERTVKPGQFWAEKNQRGDWRVEIVSVDGEWAEIRYVDACGQGADRLTPVAKLSIFVRHYDLLHESMAEAQLEALLFTRELSHLAERNRMAEELDYARRRPQEIVKAWRGMVDRRDRRIATLTTERDELARQLAEARAETQKVVNDWVV